MALKTQPNTLLHRIEAAFKSIGTHNGTKIKEPEYFGLDKSNSEREAWFRNWGIFAEYLVASSLKKFAEKRAEVAKTSLLDALKTDIKNLEPGASISKTFGNVSMAVSMRNGARRIDRDRIVTVLTTEYKWKLDDIDAFITKIEKQDRPALYITPSVNVE